MTGLMYTLRGRGVPHCSLNSASFFSASPLAIDTSTCTTITHASNGCGIEARHPETNGQRDFTNRTLEDMLCAYVSPLHIDWDDYLPCAC